MSFPYLDFFQLVHCMAAYYDPSAKKAFLCFFTSSCDMIPSSDPSKQVLQEALMKYPLNDFALTNNHSLLQWSYRVHTYFNSQMFNAPFMDYREFSRMYDKAAITMSFWSHPSWKMIHYYPSKYDGSADYALSYKAFISCLQYLLPCGKCREHLKTNLADHPIDQYFSSAVDLFTWSYILHQTVTSQTGKKGITIAEAREMYGL
jgi:hypothetical protein